MPSGTPDWYVTSRPYYGVGTSDFFVTVCPAGVETQLTIESGKGMVFFGHIHADGNVTHKLDIIRFKLDGTVLSEYTFNDLFYRYLHGPRDASVYIRNFDERQYIYSVCIGQGMTFESSIEILYDNKTAEDVTARGCLVVALV